MRRSRHPLRGQRLSYSIERLAKVCDVGRSLIYEEISAGRLIARKVGRRTIVRRSDAIRWLCALPQTAALKSQPLGNSSDDRADLPSQRLAADASRSQLTDHAKGAS
jgi:hypothetical protein